MPLTEAATEEKVVTIEEEMASDWAAIREKYKEEPEPKEDATIVDVEAAPIKDDRARDEAGKFAKADKPEIKPQETPVEAGKEVVKQPTTTSSEATSVSQPDAGQRDLTRPPSTWKPQVRGEWEKLSPNVRAEIHRREADFQNGQAQLLPDARLGNAMRAVTEPYRAIIEQSYGSPDRAMQAFLQTAGTLQLGTPQQKLAEIVRISQQFGIDLNQLSGQGEPQTQQQSFSDPRVDHLLQQMRQQDEQRRNSEQRSLETMANAWMNEKDAQGQPKRQYLADVMPEMSVLIQQIKQANPLLTHVQVLEQAYDRAVWANPDTRAALQGQQQTELLERQRTANQARVQDAKRAASVNVPRRASTPSPVKPGDMTETLTNTARELGLIS